MKYVTLLCCLTLFWTSCKSPEARRPQTQNSGSYLDQAVARNKQVVAKEEALIQELIEKDTSNSYHSSPYGFWYSYQNRDTSMAATPKFGDQVEFEYNITTLQGATIYSKDELSPKIYHIDQEELFSGLREGLKLMKEDETVTFLFPSHKAYGFYGDKDRIGRNLPIRATVTLKDITHQNNNQNQN